jgi:hypothetical protein
VDTYYRRREVWDEPFVYGHVEIPGDEHWDPGSLDHPTLFRWSATFWREGGRCEMLSDNQIEGIEFANGMRRYLDSPQNEPAEPGPNRQGFRFARRITTHIESEPPPAGFEPTRSTTEGMDLSPEEKHPD